MSPACDLQIMLMLGGVGTLSVLGRGLILLLVEKQNLAFWLKIVGNSVIAWATSVESDSMRWGGTRRKSGLFILREEFWAVGLLAGLGSPRPD